MAEDSAEDLRPPIANRRSHQRLPLRGTARVKVQRRELLADTVDISAHGVCLTLPVPLEVGGSCQLELEIQGAMQRRATVEARVCFCLQGKDGYRIGLNCALEEFVDDGAA